MNKFTKDEIIWLDQLANEMGILTMNDISAIRDSNIYSPYSSYSEMKNVYLNNRIRMKKIQDMVNLEKIRMNKESRTKSYTVLENKKNPSGKIPEQPYIHNGEIMTEKQFLSCLREEHIQKPSDSDKKYNDEFVKFRGNKYPFIGWFPSVLEKQIRQITIYRESECFICEWNQKKYKLKTIPVLYESGSTKYLYLFLDDNTKRIICPTDGDKVDVLLTRIQNLKPITV